MSSQTVHRSPLGELAGRVRRLGEQQVDQSEQSRLLLYADELEAEARREGRSDLVDQSTAAIDQSIPEKRMLQALRMQVELLEAVCHRVLAGQDDGATRNSLMVALVSCVPETEPNTPPLLRALMNVASARAETLLGQLQRGDPSNDGIKNLCVALAHARKAVREI